MTLRFHFGGDHLRPRAGRLVGIIACANWVLSGVAAQSEPPAGVPAALIEGQRIDWADLLPALTEAAGGLVLEEIVLERLLLAEADRLGVKLPSDAADAERALLGRTLATAANVPESESEALITQVCRSRGLGTTRFASLLRRNAHLRALVRSGRVEEQVPEVSENDVRQAYALKYGPRVRARLVVVRQQSEAEEAIASLAKGAAFAEVASKHSIDNSAARGGLLEPFSLDDANYPVAIRRVLSGLEPGQHSEPVAMSWGNNQGFGIVKLEERVAPPSDSPTIENSREALRAEVQLVRERSAMDRLARRLLADAKLTIFDRPLDRSWQERSGLGASPER
jgi:hypothetical protein